MALAHDPSRIASAVLIAEGDMLFFPAADGVREWVPASGGAQPSAGTRSDFIPASHETDRARPGVGHGLVFAADDGVHGVALWTSDGTEGGTHRIGPIRPSGDHTR